MKTFLQRLNIPRYFVILFIFTIINMVILGTRNYIVGDSVFDFLKSNLLSGIAPFVIAVIIQAIYPKLNTFWFIMLSLLWLLFYPNAPYMISDLIHPHEEGLNAVYPKLIVYDTLIVFSIAMLSVFYGFVSLKIMYNLFLSRWGNNWAHTAIVFSLLLSCLGFYMGRELASDIKLGNGLLYSWEVFLEPVYIVKTVWHALFPIRENANAYYMMILFGYVQYQMLVMMKDVRDIEEAKLVTKE